jgi:SAM-dependent methyltransferase
MSSVSEHYQHHLAPVYSWMCGDLTTRTDEFGSLIESLNLPLSDKIAIDLGSGHGIQSIALSKLGYKVTAIDNNRLLLEELRKNKGKLNINIIEEDIKQVLEFKNLNPDLIVCAGDTLTHLENYNEIEQFLENCCEALQPGGFLFLSFRDYSSKLNGDERFIPVKSDANRIMTCFLEYQPTQVKVTDLIYENKGDGWEQKVHSYYKFRISDSEVKDILSSCKMAIHSEQTERGMMMIVAQK